MTRLHRILASNWAFYSIAILGLIYSAVMTYAALSMGAVK